MNGLPFASSGLKNLIVCGALLALFPASPALADCTSPPGTAGTMDYFAAPDNTFKFCNGTDWVSMSGGSADAMPAGAVVAFDLTVCPPGWSEYTQARGRFLRGIDNGAGNDPSGTRAPGNTQADAIINHTHSTGFYSRSIYTHEGPANAMTVVSSGSALSTGNPTGGGTTETRPKNVAVLFCRKT